MTTYSAQPPAEGTVRIGVGAGFAGDRLEPAVLLARYAHLDALVFECLAERTIASAQERKASGCGPGYDESIVERVLSVIPHLALGVPVISNAGAADPLGAAQALRSALDAAGYSDVRVAAVEGDDVLAHLPQDPSTISANAYLGAEPIVEALRSGAQVIVTGRCADAALFLAPIIHRFGWAMDDLDRLARGTLVGHLLECAGQLTGGYFADGVRKLVPDLWNLGFPFADVDADGNATYAKLIGTGGRIDRQTVLEQLLYEIEDPSNYRTPDVNVDLRGVVVTELAVGVVSVCGAIASGRPERLKVSIGVRDGYLGTGQVTYAGPHARERAELACAIVHERWVHIHGLDATGLECQLMGINAARPWLQAPDVEPLEVTARFNLRTADRAAAEVFTREVESLYTNGPYGGGGATASQRETIGITSTMIDRDLVTTKVSIL